MMNILYWSIAIEQCAYLPLGLNSSLYLTYENLYVVASNSSIVSKILLLSSKPP